MKKILFIAVLLLTSVLTGFAQDSKKDVQDLKKALSAGFLQKYTLVQSLHNYSISAQGRIIQGNFERYSHKDVINLTTTDFALYEYYAGRDNFIVITVVRDGIAKVFVDLDADGELDEYISAGSSFPGNLFQKEYAMYLSFSVHG
jgi:hypothetical protein